MSRAALSGAPGCEFGLWAAAGQAAQLRVGVGADSSPGRPQRSGRFGVERTTCRAPSALAPLACAVAVWSRASSGGSAGVRAGFRRPSWWSVFLCHSLGGLFPLAAPASWPEQAAYAGDGTGRDFTAAVSEGSAWQLPPALAQGLGAPHGAGPPACPERICSPPPVASPAPDRLQEGGGGAETEAAPPCSLFAPVTGEGASPAGWGQGGWLLSPPPASSWWLWHHSESGPGGVRCCVGCCGGRGRAGQIHSALFRPWRGVAGPKY